MLWVLAANADNTLSPAVAAEEGEAVFTDALDGRAYFHGSGSRSCGIGGGSSCRRRCGRSRNALNGLIGTETVRNPPFLQIIRCHFHAYPVSGEDMHAVNAHTTCQVTE